MAINNVSGATFKKMIMKATGTKGYLSSSVQGALRQNKAQKFLNSGAKVSKHQATKVIQHLKEAGLAHKVTSNATAYTGKAFHREDNRQEMIKGQHLAERQKEVAAEKAAEIAKTTSGKGGSASGGKASQTKPAHKATAGASVQMAAGNITSTLSPTSSSNDVPLSSGVAKTNLKPLSELPTPIKRPDEWIDQDKNLIDLAID